MRYLYTKHIDLPEVEIYFEIEEDGWATRQIIIEGDKIEISCKNYCLAEGSILEWLQSDILGRLVEENDIKYTWDDIFKYIELLRSFGSVFLTKEDFENKWSIYTEEFYDEWEVFKKTYSVGEVIYCVVEHYYPMGTVVSYDSHNGIVKSSETIPIGELVKCKITGFDDVNMWVELQVF